MRSLFAACLLALVFGAAMTLSFAPANAWWFTPFCLAGLFLLAEGARPARAALLGLFFGLGWFGAGLWWMGAGLARYTEAGPWLSIALCAGLVIYLSLFRRPPWRLPAAQARRAS